VREPIHPRGGSALASTLEGSVDSPSRRKPEQAVAPELDAACIAALTAAPSSRPSARELADRVQRYLDGDRDLEQRRKLANEQHAVARAALATGDRGRAMHAGGRALALDPESAAAELVTQLMLEPPRDPPPALQAEILATDAADIRRHARRAAIAYFSVVLLLPLAMWNGVRSWSLGLGFLVLALVLSAAAWQIVARPQRTLREMAVYAAGNAALVALLGRMLGPFLIVPAVVCVLTMSMMSYPSFARRSPILVAFMSIGWLVPIALEQLGLLRPTWAVVNGSLVSWSYAIDVNGSSTIVLVLVTTFVTITVAGFLSGAYVRAHLDAKHQLVAQAWHLRQLLPATHDGGVGR
jgi:eukaryotic-like serine/threonine-protein kinase